MALNPINWFNRLKQGLSKTRDNLVSGLENIFTSRASTAQRLEELEELLVSSDLGVEVSQKLLDLLREELGRRELTDSKVVKECLKKALLQMLDGGAGGVGGGAYRRSLANYKTVPHKPWVIVFIGVNGVGKTTTIGKLAGYYRKQGAKVMLAAGDTFRAAAGQQLDVWAQRVGADIVQHQSAADPAAVVYDALTAATSRNIDILMIDTAGRLHTKQNLMQELEKVKRVIERNMPGAPHEMWLILDANTGQNGLQQALQFHKQMQLSGLVLTKMDSTAKGGVAVSIMHQVGVPIRFMGIGEGTEDIVVFEPDEFVAALLGEQTYA